MPLEKIVSLITNLNSCISLRVQEDLHALRHYVPVSDGNDRAVDVPCYHSALRWSQRRYSARTGAEMGWNGRTPAGALCLRRRSAQSLRSCKSFDRLRQSSFVMRVEVMD